MANNQVLVQTHKLMSMAAGMVWKNTEQTLLIVSPDANAKETAKMEEIAENYQVHNELLLIFWNEVI